MNHIKLTNESLDIQRIFKNASTVRLPNNTDSIESNVFVQIGVRRARVS